MGPEVSPKQRDARASRALAHTASPAHSTPDLEGPELWGTGFGVQGLGFRAQGFEFRVKTFGFRVWGLESLGLRVLGFF